MNPTSMSPAVNAWTPTSASTGDVLSALAGLGATTAEFGATTVRNGMEVGRCPKCGADQALEVCRDRDGGAGSQIRCLRGCAGGDLLNRLGLAQPPARVANRSRSAPRGGNGTKVVPGTNGNDGNDGNHSPSVSEAGRSREKQRERLFEPLTAFMERASKQAEPSWLVDGLVPDTGRLFVVSAPNAGKTFMALVIAKTAAVAGRPVFLVLEEGGTRRTGDRFRNLAFDPALPVHVAHLRGVQLDDPSVIAQLQQLLKEHPAPVLVLDPFAAIFSGDENDTRAMNAARAHLDDLANVNPGALLCVLHHTSKAGERGDAGPGMYAARGSSILPAWADVQLNLKHEKAGGADRVSFSAKVEKNRDGERGKCVRVTIALGSGEVTLDEIVEAASNATLVKKILELVAATPGLSRDALAKAVGGRKSSSLAEIDRLSGEGSLEKTDQGYRVAPKPQKPDVRARAAESVDDFEREATA